MLFKAEDENFETRVRESFGRQQLMTTLGAQLTVVEPGIVEIELAHRSEITQQNGFIHAGAVASVLDTACGYAAYTLMPADAGVLSIEFKVNLLSPATGERLIAHAEVKRAGRTVTVCSADALSIRGSETKLVATMLATMMRVKERLDLSE